MNPKDHRASPDAETMPLWALRPRRTHRVECWLSEQEYRSLCAASVREDRAGSSVLRQALKAYLQRDANPK